MSSEFTSNKNKSFLWDFLYKNGVFKNLKSSHENRVKDIFEHEIMAIKDSTISQNITELNKAFISKIIKEIETLKIITNSSTIINADTSNDSHNIKPTMNYTHQEAAAERQKIFQNSLQDTQNHFNEHMKVNKPKSIDFSDKDLDDVDHNLDSKLEEIIERRKRDMNMVVSSYDTKSPRNSDNISIGKETKLDHVQIVDIEQKRNKKTVSFDENNITQLLGKNMDELFNKQKLVQHNEVDSVNTLKENHHEDKEVTIDTFLSGLKTIPISENQENNSDSDSEILEKKDNDKFQIILHEIADIHKTLRNMLDLIQSNK